MKISLKDVGENRIILYVGNNNVHLVDMTKEKISDFLEKIKNDEEAILFSIEGTEDNQISVGMEEGGFCYLYINIFIDSEKSVSANVKIEIPMMDLIEALEKYIALV
jgi:hypothetical protein